MIRTTMPIGVLDYAVLSPPLVRDHPLPCTDEPDPIRPLTVVVRPQKAPEARRVAPPTRKPPAMPEPKPGSLAAWARVRRGLDIDDGMLRRMNSTIRAHDVVAMRERAAVALRAAGLSYVEISRIFKRNHSTFTTAVARYEERLQLEKSLHNMSGSVRPCAESLQPA